jgi:hypothetical protein
VPERTELRERILAAARRLLGHHSHLDCSGFILAAFRAAGLSVALAPRRSRSEALLAAGGAVAIPQPGDLAFFHDTYDRNRNGKADDGITHVALVEAVDGDVVTLLHRGHRVERIQMDLASPSDRTTNGLVRFKRHRDARRTRYLAGELFTAYGALPLGNITEPLHDGPDEDTLREHATRRWSSKRSHKPRPEPSPSKTTRSMPGKAPSIDSAASTRSSSSP